MTDTRLILRTGRPALDAAAVSADGLDLVVLDDCGDLVGVDLGTGDQRVLCRVELPPLRQQPGDRRFTPEGVRLSVTADAALAVLVRDGGRDGIVVDLAVGTVLRRLVNDGHHCATVRFAAALTRHGDRRLLVHRTAWNRLDASDALTGELLTGRALPDGSAGKDPEHDLDYFHGSLAISPGGRFVADGGWMWTPIGILRTWSLPDWLTRNPWESEDGPSVRQSVLSDDWDLPMTWVTDDLLVLACPGDWDDEEFEQIPAPHLRLVDPAAPEDAPRRRIPVDPLPTALLTDGRLILGTVDGTATAWDPDTGAVAWHWSDLAPTVIDHRGRRAVRVDGTTITVRDLP
ncbi:hypothetical protein [Cellulomonas sp. RIT-PI-Y]|uniref:hypothetical protein n=1 Tax=Cellulomonas sp. RIT-PI-Y TaxID=3035297 RepID=UPI0021D88EF9|nr:hypothetical protein [Cellulomonas sp. RIT-PI-Y]